MIAAILHPIGPDHALDIRPICPQGQGGGVRQVHLEQERPLRGLSEERLVPVKCNYKEREI